MRWGLKSLDGNEGSGSAAGVDGVGGEVLDRSRQRGQHGATDLQEPVLHPAVQPRRVCDARKQGLCRYLQFGEMQRRSRVDAASLAPPLVGSLRVARAGLDGMG